ncbi:arginine/serine-rich protein PNISR-like [Toxorhynchites rutilus septentrionalis]|uniref:arginine/serine-rich protein PNISR-like n=1 Tax=Toxorhynchites rutilus septentrionalis TaxID=329112 RepID=UPI0024795514|nr:arginine/serine-rich protein PNISR-like [Toxorhynchites rutilus septentrionalis]XP_055639941.1 arginine/serine-rich protein PNISR-like [Toxorhynchites rutilus septentrionalis]
MATPVGYGALLECPYNKAHRVQATAMARHLFKCRKMYPDVVLVTCPFNHAHKIAEPELKMHTATCEDRANFDMYKYCITTAAATHTSKDVQEPELIYNREDPIAPNKVQDDDECWDDLRLPAYNPQEYCATAKIIRKATLKTPSEKKVFYEEEMKRHQVLDVKIKQEFDDVKDGSSSSGGRHASRSHSRIRNASRSRSRSRRSRSNSRKSRSITPTRERKFKRSRSRSVEATKQRKRGRSRSVETKRSSKRSRSRSVERRYRRSPSPAYRRNPYAMVSYPTRVFDRYASDDFRNNSYAGSSSSYEPYGGYSRPDYYVRYDRYERDRRPAHRVYSPDREDEEYIYRRDFRD